MTTAETETIWQQTDSLLCPDTAAVVVNYRAPFGYIASGRYATLVGARRAAKRMTSKPEYAETHLVTRGNGDNLVITSL